MVCKMFAILEKLQGYIITRHVIDTSDLDNCEKNQKTVLFSNYIFFTTLAEIITLSVF